MFQKPSPLPVQPVEEPRFTSHSDEVETVVGPSVNVEGDFSSEGNIVVKGTVSGSVKTSKRLTVETGAKILANVKGESAIISGHIKGNIKVTEMLELTETAQILGDIECQTLVVAAGALLQGKVSMKGLEEERSEKRKTLGRVKERFSEVMEEAAV